MRHDALAEMRRLAVSRGRLGVAALTAATLALSACQSTGSASAPLSKAELFAKANAICRRASIRHDTFDENPNRVYFFSQYAAEEKAESSELNALVAPASMASDWRRITAGEQEVAADLTKVASDVKSNASKLPASLTAATAHALEQVLTTAKRDGLAECSRTDLR